MKIFLIVLGVNVAIALAVLGYFYYIGKKVKKEQEFRGTVKKFVANEERKTKFKNKYSGKKRYQKAPKKKM